MTKPGPRHAVQLTETHDLDAFRRPMGPVSDRVRAAIDGGVAVGDGPPAADPNALLDVDGRGDGLVDAVVRTPAGQLVVACRTEMPGVTSAMWDWWFAWHSYTSERYRLWHPEDHKAAAIAEDRRHLPVIRDRWVGNTSYVDELIGGRMQRLAIRFVPPDTVGLDADRVDEIGLAVCARTVLRRERLAAGHLVHLVEDTADGCVMHSRFLLGDARSEVPAVGPLVSRAANSAAVRQHLLPDGLGLALLLHCSQEMNHLATILADLHDRFGTE